MSGSVARRVAKAVLARRATVASPTELMVPTVVVAPHPDDETLGCGVLIAAKRRLGAEVAVVFLTDGAASHPQFGSDRLAPSGVKKGWPHAPDSGSPRMR